MHDSDSVAASRMKGFSPPQDWIEREPGPSALPLDPSVHRFLARQPIFNLMGEIYGYELLFRLGSDNYFAGDSDAATRMMVDNWLLHGFEDLTLGSPTFLNCTREALVEGLVTLLPSSWTVLELLETIEPDDEVVSACKRMKRLGYGIALDDFQFSPKMERLLEVADYVKVDFRVPERQRCRTVHQLEGRGIRLVAEKIETEEELRIAFEEGFELFQGYFLSSPKVFSQRKTPADAAHYRNLRDALTASWFETGKVMQLLKSEASIGCRLLRLTNSAAFGLGGQVRSIDEALVMIGEDQFRMLTMLAVGAETGESAEELLLSAPRRADFPEVTSLATRRIGKGLHWFRWLLRRLEGPVAAVMDLLRLRRGVVDALPAGVSKGRTRVAGAAYTTAA